MSACGYRKRRLRAGPVSGQQPIPEDNMIRNKHSLWSPTCMASVVTSGQNPWIVAVQNSNSRAGGTKNRQVMVSRQHKLTLAMYKGCNLRLDERLQIHDVELEKIRWHVRGISVVQRQGEGMIIIELGLSGHFFHFREGSQKCRVA